MSNEITPEQSSLLERPNFAQYPTEQELSNSKDTTSSQNNNELEGENVHSTIGEQVQAAEAEVNTNLAEAHVKAETPTISQESKQVSDLDNAPYTITPAQYTTKKGKVLDMHLVKFAGTLTKEQQRAAKELAKAEKGWYDREQGGFMMRSKESAKQLAETIFNNDEAADDISNTEEDDDVLYRSDDATKNRIEALFNQAISGEFKGKPISIGTLTDEGKAYLEQISGVAFKDKVDFVLNPSDLVHIYKDHFGNNEKDKGQNIPLDIEDIRSLADVITMPDKVVFFKEGEGSNRNMFYFFKEAENGTYNLMEIYSDRKGNLTAKTFYKTRKDASQRVMDIEKSLLPTSETYFGAILSDAKIPQMFETPSVEDNYSREGVGSYTDDELVLESDPVSKVIGEPRYGRGKKMREYAERQRRFMVQKVQEIARKLNLDNVEIVTDASTLLVELSF